MRGAQWRNANVNNGKKVKSKDETKLQLDRCSAWKPVLPHL